MMSDEKLHALLVNVSDLEAAGLLDEVREEIAHRLYPRPADPIHGLTGNQYLTAHWLADSASRLLDVPHEDALRVAVELFIPSRQQVAVEVVERYAANLDSEGRPQEPQPETKPRQSRPVVVNIQRRRAAQHGK
jgi:hypothetical protein